MHAALLAAVLATAPVEAPAERPWLFASAYLSPMTAIPERLSAYATVHAIPWVDLSGGVSFFPATFGWFVRGGPRITIDDWRDEAHRGVTLRLALLAGYRQVQDARVDGGGFSGVVTVDLTYFVARHFGLAVQAAGGGSWDGNGKRVVPELRLGVGVAF